MKKEEKKVELTKEELKELKTLIQIVNEPRQQNLQTAGFLITLSNKMSSMIDQK